MTQEQFEAACAAAIAEYHDLQEDGPLLVSVRPKAQFNTQSTQTGQWAVWPTYAAVLADWPERPNGTNYGHYCDEPDEAIEALTRIAKAYWVSRQPEEAHEPDIYDRLLDSPEQPNDWREDAQRAQFEVEGKGR